MKLDIVSWNEFSGRSKCCFHVLVMPDLLRIDVRPHVVDGRTCSASWGVFTYSLWLMNHQYFWGIFCHNFAVVFLSLWLRLKISEVVRIIQCSYILNLSHRHRVCIFLSPNYQCFLILLAFEMDRVCQLLTNAFEMQCMHCRYGLLTSTQSQIIHQEVAALCGELRPHALALVDSLGIPLDLLGPIASDWVEHNSYKNVLA